MYLLLISYKCIYGFLSEVYYYDIHKSEKPLKTLETFFRMLFLGRMAELETAVRGFYKGCDLGICRLTRYLPDPCFFAQHLTKQSNFRRSEQNIVGEKQRFDHVREKQKISNHGIRYKTK